MSLMVSAIGTIATRAIIWPDAPLWLLVLLFTGLFMTLTGATLRWGPGLLARWKRRHVHELPRQIGRTGYIGRPGSTGDLSRARFSDRLQTGIENEGTVDASEATFGERGKADEDAQNGHGR